MRQALANVQLGAITIITVAFLWATMPQSAHAEPETMPLCYPVSLKGSEHTLNPNAPKDRRVQEQATICDYVIVVDGKDRHVEKLERPVIIPPQEGHPA